MLKIAQIGVGYWGPNLLRNLVTNENIIVKIAVDRSDERRKFIINKYPGIKVTDNTDLIFKDNDINAVVIATPVRSHFDLTMQALDSGKHVLVEKPMATNIEQVRRIRELANKKDLIAMVGHTFLFNNAVRYVKKIIDKGELGDIRYIYSQRVNLGRIRNDVDALWNFAPHDISIIQYWLNEPQPLDSTINGMDYIQKGINDVVFMNIKYPGNIMANIHVSWLDPHKIRRMTIVGSKKMAVYDDLADNKITIYDKGVGQLAILGEQMDFDDQTDCEFIYRSGDKSIPKIKWVEPLKLEIEHFVDCIIDGVPCIAGVDHAEKVVRILNMK
tara:strand:+ start:496 stop:1482 length:987 start_codon:yes stop_codon:yes gene_type:complete